MSALFSPHLAVGSSKKSKPCHPRVGPGLRELKAKQVREGLKAGHYVRNGYYFRHSDGKRVGRFICKVCRRGFSWGTTSPCFGQKKRQVNAGVEELLASGVSQRRIARLLGISLDTVANKFRFLARQARMSNDRYLTEIKHSGRLVSNLDFDEMQSFEHSKCKPLSIPIAVEVKTRKILGCKVCIMPANGPLAQISRKRYGIRPDEREEASRLLLKKIRPALTTDVSVMTDKKSTYPTWLKRSLGKFITHTTVKGARGCVVGQGELKALAFDPLFDLNHSAAMIRANVNRMFRRTWNTTKIASRLEWHLNIYIRYHNEVLTAPREEVLNQSA